MPSVVGIPSPNQKSWQAYLVPNLTDVASMHSPLCYHYCKYTWSPWLLVWHANLVPIIQDVASIPSPYNIHHLLCIRNFIKVSMWVGDQMCWIHIWTISFQLCPSFKPRQGLNAKGTWKTNWYEKTGLHSFTPRNQFVLWTKTTETMPAGAKMPTRWLHQENLQRDHMIFISGFIWVDTYCEIIF